MGKSKALKTDRCFSCGSDTLGDGDRIPEHAGEDLNGFPTVTGFWCGPCNRTSPMLVGGEASERYLVERFDDVDARDPKAPKWRELMGRLGETDWEWRRGRVQFLRSENQ